MGSHITQTLADFVYDTDYASLPSEVVDYMKLVILDTLIGGTAAGGFERSCMMHEAVRGLGGPQEASVFGMSERVPAAHTAMLMRRFSIYSTPMIRSSFPVTSRLSIWPEPCPKRSVSADRGKT